MPPDTKPHLGGWLGNKAFAFPRQLLTELPFVIPPPPMPPACCRQVILVLDTGIQGGVKLANPSLLYTYVSYAICPYVK